jgi:hypothetical protein
VPTRQERASQSRAPRRVIHATCRTHGGCIGFTNLVVTKRDGVIELAPHVTGQCVMTVATNTSSPPCISGSTFSITVCATPSTDRHTLTARNGVPSWPGT